MFYMKMRTPKKIVGLDLSLTSTGVVVYNFETQVADATAVRTYSKQSYMHRYNHILNEVKKATLGGNTVFFIEGYSFGSFSKSTAMSNLIELGGIIRFYLWGEGVSFIVVPPTLLKKFVTGKGNAKKEDIKLGIYKRYACEFETSDEADAYGLMAMGYAYFMGKLINGKELTNIERDCISKLKGDENDAEAN